MLAVMPLMAHAQSQTHMHGVEVLHIHDHCAFSHFCAGLSAIMHDLMLVIMAPSVNSLNCKLGQLIAVYPKSFTLYHLMLPWNGFIT